MNPRTALLSGWLGVALVIAVVCGAPILLQRGARAKRPFDEKPGRRLAKENPALVLIGDSMLETRIEPRRLNELADLRCSVLAQPGSSSAMWFLMLKNLVAELRPPPRWVVIFFRDRQLTIPRHRTEGGYRPTMEGYMHDEEPLVDALVPLAGPRHERWLERASLAVWPVQHRRDVWGEKVKNWALDAVASSRDYQTIREATAGIFELKKLRSDSGYNESAPAERLKLDDDAHDFPSAVGQSFLPPTLAVAREHGIRLLFFRIKRKPQADGSPDKESPTLPAYLRELRTYLESAGARLIDESQDTSVTPDFYGPDDHVAPAMQRRYTELFWPKIRAAIQPPPEPDR